MGAKIAPTSHILRSNFGLQFPMPFSMAPDGLRGRTRGPRWRRTGGQAGAGVLTEPDSGGIWHVISYAVHQSRTDAADFILEASLCTAASDKLRLVWPLGCNCW